MEWQASAQHYDCSLRVPVVVNVRHPEGHHLCGEAMQVTAKPHVLPAATHNEGCREREEEDDGLSQK